MDPSLWGPQAWESEFRYPYRFDDDRENLNASDDYRRVLRGGAFHDNDYHVRAAIRYWVIPYSRFFLIGFRVVFSPFTTDH
jgi:formylglycine-generating enzyme required for sulfatase activity